jgi:hypothetical protein
MTQISSFMSHRLETGHLQKASDKANVGFVTTLEGVGIVEFRHLGVHVTVCVIGRDCPGGTTEYFISRDSGELDSVREGGITYRMSYKGQVTIEDMGKLYGVINAVP